MLPQAKARWRKPEKIKYLMSLFVTFEGPEGSGKSTQARLLYGWLSARGYPAILVREPGGTRIGDMIRRIVLDLQNTEMAPNTETLLFAASREIGRASCRERVLTDV